MNKLFIFVFVLCSAITSFSQIYQKYDDGTIILINLDTTAPVAKSAFGDKLRMWQVRPPNTNKLVRYITNDNSGYRVGYTLEYECLNNNRFKVSIYPPDDSISNFPYKTKYELRKLSNYPKDIIINDGDVIVLDLLENNSKNIKAQDKILLTKQSLSSRNYFGDLEKPKDFSIDQIKLYLTEFEVMLNGEKLKQKSLFDVKGHILAFHFKNKGKVFLSLFPHQEFNFKKIGTISGKVASFKINSDSYRITSGSSIWDNNDDEETKWTLWGFYIPEDKLKDKVPDNLDYKGEIINKLTKRELEN